jgi:hypothetical protein
MASPTILFVEAERLTATLVTRVPKAGGYEVLNARAGTAALALGPPDLRGPDVALRPLENSVPRELMQTKATAGIDREGAARVSATY